MYGGEVEAKAKSDNDVVVKVGSGFWGDVGGGSGGRADGGGGVDMDGT